MTVLTDTLNVKRVDVARKMFLGQTDMERVTVPRLIVIRADTTVQNVGKICQ
jgi:hypothetical protein